MNTAPPALVEVDHVRQLYPKGSGENLLVLDDVSLKLRKDEIVSLLGRSGCGKSSLLRVIAGLMPASEGKVAIGGRTVAGPAHEVAMVFQTFALFPWLTVLENVEIGLEALRIDSAERHKRALAGNDLIGLDGYESAYPKELSGGMRQRVGLARALVVHPKVLLMDEAVLGARRADRRDAAHRPARPVERGACHFLHPAGDPQHRGGGADVRPHPRLLLQPGRVVAEIPVTADAAQPAGSGIPAIGRRHLAQMTASRPANRRRAAFRHRHLHAAAARVSPNLLAGLMETLAAGPTMATPTAALAGPLHAGDRRPLPGGRDPAAHALRRAGRRRSQAHRRRPALR
jgi:NitT/TauT family transport system ATP-binding protein